MKKSPSTISTIAAVALSACASRTAVQPPESQATQAASSTVQAKVLTAMERFSDIPTWKPPYSSMSYGSQPHPAIEGLQGRLRDHTAAKISRATTRRDPAQADDDDNFWAQQQDADNKEDAHRLEAALASPVKPLFPPIDLSTPRGWGAVNIACEQGVYDTTQEVYRAWFAINEAIEAQLPPNLPGGYSPVRINVMMEQDLDNPSPLDLVEGLTKYAARINETTGFKQIMYPYEPLRGGLPALLRNAGVKVDLEPVIEQKIGTTEEDAKRCAEKLPKVGALLGLMEQLRHRVDEGVGAAHKEQEEILDKMQGK
ncbi:hypothetical protein KBD59_00570 [Candidatus Gracilibacteria bacterium]|nr:hypothetical protein [Candidatus Gracilibacteria bacterium]